MRGGGGNVREAWPIGTTTFWSRRDDSLPDFWMLDADPGQVANPEDEADRRTRQQRYKLQHRRTARYDDVTAVSWQQANTLG